MHSWRQSRISTARVLGDVLFQYCCIGKIAHQNGSIAAPACASQNTHTTEKEKGMVLCEFYLKLKSCPLPFPLPPELKCRLCPWAACTLLRGEGEWEGAAFLPLAKVKKLVKTQKSKNCTEFALSADTKNECQKKSSGCQLPGRWFSTVSILGAVLYQYWSNTGANNVTEVYQ